MDSPLKYFAELRDPRVERTREHLLEEILLITIAAILSGANGWNEIEDYADSKARVVAEFSDACGRDSLARHVPSGVLGAGSGGVGEGLRGLGVIDCQVDGGRSRCHRR